MLSLSSCAIISSGVMLLVALAGCNWSGSDDTVGGYLDLIGQARLANGNREYDKAIAVSNEAIARWPENPLGYMTRGLAYGHKKQYDQAGADFSIAIDLAPMFLTGEVTELSVAVIVLLSSDSVLLNGKRKCPFG